MMTFDQNLDSRSSPPRKSRVTAFLMGLAAGILLTIFVPRLLHLRAAVLQSACADNMKHILLALHSYHDQYGTFPPAFTVDAEGKKLQSWRVLILPQLGKEELYRQIRLDEPWDSDHNKQFQTQMPEFFCCPADKSKLNRNETSYVWLTGPGLVSDGTSCTKITDIADGTSNTLMLIETLNPICWMSPEDTTMEQCWTDHLSGVAPNSTKGISSNHRVIANLGFVDGLVSPMNHYDFYTIDRIATIADGETICSP